jgi:hypothetical protein
VTDAPDLFSSGDAPHFCRECAYRCAALTGPASSYCDLSKQDLAHDALACGAWRKKEE